MLYGSEYCASKQKDRTENKCNGNEDAYMDEWSD